jgi:hypothetical protein
MQRKDETAKQTYAIFMTGLWQSEHLTFTCMPFACSCVLLFYPVCSLQVITEPQCKCIAKQKNKMTMRHEMHANMHKGLQSIFIIKQYRNLRV